MKVAVAYVTCALIWGTTWYAIRACIGEGGYPTYAAAALRFTLAAVVLVALVVAVAARPGPRGRREWSWIIVAGLLNSVGYGLVYAGEVRITGGVAAVLYGTAPLMMAAVAPLTGTERPTAASLAGALVSLTGIGLIFWDELAVSPAHAAGVGMILGSVFCSTLYNIIFKRHAGEQHPLATNAVFLATTSVALWGFAFTVERRPVPWPPPAAPTVALLYLGIVGSVVAFAVYFYLLKRVRLMTLSSLTLVTPVVALAADALWEAQRVGPRTYAGAAITLGGVLVGMLLRPQKV